MVLWLIRNCKKTVGSFKDKIVSLLKTNTTKIYGKPTRSNNVYKGQKIVNAIKNKIIGNTRSFFEQEEEVKDYLLQTKKGRKILKRQFYFI